MGRASLSIRRLDVPIYPRRGVSFDLRYAQSLAVLGEYRLFRTLSTEGVLARGILGPLSVSASWRAASDFSVMADDATAAPPYHKPELSDRRLFPGPLTMSERIGSHVAGLGLEAALALDDLSRTVGLPCFGTFQAAAGAALQDRAEASDAVNRVHCNVAVGLGTRAGDGFGASLRAGLAIGSDGSLAPFLALDLGSIGYR
jgi:hypothetical protein